MGTIYEAALLKIQKKNWKKVMEFFTWPLATGVCTNLLTHSLFNNRKYNDFKFERFKLRYKTAVIYILTGLMIYWGSYFSFFLAIPITHLAILYMGLTSMGFILVLTGGKLLSRVIRLQFNNKDIFNKENETFPQEERLLQNEYSINLPATYYLKGKLRKSWINIINPFRSLLVLGSPGSGKSYFVIQHVIKQHIQKGFAMLVYDFKFDDLSLIAYNAWLKYKHVYKKEPAIYFIDFEKLLHRCNPYCSIQEICSQFAYEVLCSPESIQ